jgi:threonine/homoserine efflux transporter RhtA
MNKFSKKIVALVVALNAIFTGVVLYVFLRTGSEPTTLIGCWFAFTTGELWMLANIRKAKLRGGDNGEPPI